MLTPLSHFHCLRPYWLIGLVLLLVGYLFLQRTEKKAAASKHLLCDPHLLPYILVHSPSSATLPWLRLLLFLSLAFMIFALSGPCWKYTQTTTYQSNRPHIVLLDASSDMQASDVLPNRLERAKFKLQDLTRAPAPPPIGLILYSAEPFVASPITEDAQTLGILVQSIHADLLPVDGNEASLALKKAEDLTYRSGYASSDLLLMTGYPPTDQTKQQMHTLRQKGFTITLLPLVSKHSVLLKSFIDFSTEEDIHMIPYSNTSTDILSWINTPSLKNKKLKNEHEYATWQDEGRWFILCALFCLLPLFRRGALEHLP